MSIWQGNVRNLEDLERKAERGTMIIKQIRRDKDKYKSGGSGFARL
jgi:hypothetical protein